MAFGIQAWTHERDQGIRRHQQHQGDPNQARPHDRVDRRQHMGPILPGSPGQHAHHGAMERAINPPQQDQQKARKHIGVVVGVIGGTHTKGRRNHLLPHQARHLAEGRGHGHDQGNPA